MIVFSKLLEFMPEDRNNAGFGGRPFGQQQPIHVAIHTLIRNYPLGVGLFKEFIQNADDAGARKIAFIIDERDHPHTHLPNERLIPLQGPALLVWNDSVFTPEDLANIQRLGDSSKAENPAKTGRFGLGFNSCYNVTDYPVLVTGTTFCLFDPHQSALPYSGTTPGYSWDLSELWSSGRDLLAPFGGLWLQEGDPEHNGTVFRLPLRTEQHIAINGKIRKEPCTTVSILGLVESFQGFAPKILLFLKSVQEVSIGRIRREGNGVIEEILTARITNPEEVEAHRARIRLVLSGSISEVLDRLKAGSDEQTHSTYEIGVCVAANRASKSQHFNWLVSTGIWPDTSHRLLTIASNLFNRGEKALPLVGVATLIDASEPETALNIRGDVFCFLPLPDVISGRDLPVQINGFFDIDSSRRGLTHEVGAQDSIEHFRAEWNRALIEDGVAAAYAQLLVELTTLVGTRLSIEQFYLAWPGSSDGLPEPINRLPDAVYRRVAGLPLIHSASGKWRAVSEIRHVTGLIHDALVADAIDGVASPAVPPHLLRGFERTENPIAKLTPSRLREWFRTDRDLACKPIDTDRPSLRRPEWLQALAKEALAGCKDGSDDAKGLPFLLLANGDLHTLGHWCQTTYLANTAERELFAASPEMLLDAEFARASNFPQLPTVGVLRMTADHVIALVADICATSESPERRPWSPESVSLPNSSWLEQLLKYFAHQPQQWVPKPDFLSRCCLVPDRDDFLWRLGLLKTPYLGSSSMPKSLVTVLEKVGVHPVHASVETQSGLLSLGARVNPGMIRTMGPVVLVNLLVALQPLTGLEGHQISSILGYLSTEQSLAELNGSGPAILARLRTLPIFPLCDGTLACLDNGPAYLPTETNIPKAKFRFKLLKAGLCDPLLRLLQIEGLTLTNFIRDVLISDFPLLTQAEQDIVLVWLRDTFDRALTEAGPNHAELLTRLQSAPLVLCEDEMRRPGNQLYNPRDSTVREVLAERAHFPRLPESTAEADRWLIFYQRLGMEREIRPQDLTDFILAKRRAAEGQLTPSIASSLNKVLAHVAEHWAVLKDASVAVSAGIVQPFRTVLTREAWCPALRDEAQLRRFIAYKVPPMRLFRLEELSAKQRGNLLASQRHLLPINVPIEFLSDLCPQTLDTPFESVALQFEMVLEMERSQPNTEAGFQALIPVLTSIYSHWGTRFDSGDAEGETEEVRRLRDRFRDQPCILVEELREFRRPNVIFKSKVGPAKHWFLVASFKNEAVDLGLKALGRKDEPDYEDFCRLTLQLADQYPGPLGKDLVDRVLNLLGAIAVQLPSDLNPLPDVRVLDSQCHLVSPLGLFFHDANWLPVPQSGSIPLAHSQTPDSLVDKLGIKRLSQHARPQPKGDFSPTEKATFRQKVEAMALVLWSTEFVAGLRRILIKHQTLPDGEDFVWMKTIVLHPVRVILCDWVVEVAGTGVELGESEDNVFKSGLRDGNMALYLSEKAATVLENVVAEELRELMVSRGLPSIPDLSPLTCILRTSPGDIREALDHLHYPRLPTEPQIGEEESAATPEGSSLFDEKSEPCVAGGDHGSHGDSERGGENREVMNPDEPEGAADTQVESQAPEEHRSDPSNARKPEQDAEEPATPRTNREISNRPSATGNGGGFTRESEPGWERFHEGHRSTGGGSRPASDAPPRDRVVTYVLTPEQVDEAARRRDLANDELPDHKRIGDDAVGWVLQYERHQGRHPEAQAHNNPGFDVLSRGPGLKPPRFIEVKGIRGGWGRDGVPLSVKQFEFAQKHGNQFWLYVVEYADDPDEATIHPIQNPAARINQFRFDSGWKELTTAELSFRPVLPAPGIRLRFRKEDGSYRDGVIRSVGSEPIYPLLQVLWDNGHQGAVVFRPLTVELTSP